VYATLKQGIPLLFCYICVQLCYTDMMTKKERTERDVNVRKWFKAGVAQAVIGKRLGLTRQRIQQIENELGLSRGDLRFKKEYSAVCSTCKKTFKDTKPNRKYCSRECFRLSRIKSFTPEEEAQREQIRKKKNRAKAKHYYHNVFKQRKDWKKVVKERNEKYYANNTTD